MSKKKKQELRKEFRELLDKHGLPLVKILEEQDERVSDPEAMDFEDIVLKILGRLVMRKIEARIRGDRGFSFGGVSWELNGQTGKGSISVLTNDGWVEIVSFSQGDNASVVLSAGLNAIKSLVASGNITPEQGRRLKAFLFIAIIEMINQGVLVDDLEAQTHIDAVNDFIKDTVLDERFSEGVPG